MGRRTLTGWSYANDEHLHSRPPDRTRSAPPPRWPLARSGDPRDRAHPTWDVMLVHPSDGNLARCDRVPPRSMDAASATDYLRR
jgi:hypothetical protein